MSTFILKHAASTPTSLQGTSGVWECTTSLQSDAPTLEPGPPGCGLHPTPCRGAPKAHPAAEATEAWRQGPAQVLGHHEDPGGHLQLPTPLPPLLAGLSGPCCHCRGQPSVSGQPAPGVVWLLGVTQASLSKPMVAGWDSQCFVPGAWLTRGTPLQDMLPPVAEAAGLTTAPRAFLPAVMGPSPHTRPSSLQVTGADGKSCPRRALPVRLTRCKALDRSTRK